ncbi:MAG: hypothetical protein ACREMD_04595 [Gemmatimonadota bacterium]
MPARHSARALVLALALLGACRADVWVEGPDERRRTATRGSDPDTATVVADTIYRSIHIDSVAASFAWLVRPEPRLPSERSFPTGPVEAARQFVRALAQTGSGSLGMIGIGGVGYERAFTYVHPEIRGQRTAAEWSAGLAGVVRPSIVRMEPVPGDSTRVFAELLVLRDEGGESLLGLYYGHFAAAPGDNGWQLAGARFASEDWQAALRRGEAWRYDRAAAAARFVAEDSLYARDLVQLESGEWVPLSRPAPSVDLTLGLPTLR